VLARAVFFVLMMEAHPMAVRIGGQIQADITPFTTALQQAGTALSQFETTAEAVAVRVNQSFAEIDHSAQAAVADVQGLGAALQNSGGAPVIDLGPLRQAATETAAAFDQAGGAAEAGIGRIDGAVTQASQALTGTLMPAASATEATILAFPTPFERLGTSAQAMAGTVSGSFDALSQALNQALALLNQLPPATEADARSLESLGDSPVTFGPLRTGLDGAGQSVQDFADSASQAMARAVEASEDAGAAVGRSATAYEGLSSTAHEAAAALEGLHTAQVQEQAAAAGMVDQAGLVRQAFEQTTATAAESYDKTLQYWGALEQATKAQGALLNSPDFADSASEAQRRAWSLNLDTGETIQQNPYNRSGSGLNYLAGGLDESLSRLRYQVEQVLEQIGVDFDQGFATARDLAGAAITAIGEGLGHLPELASQAATSVRAIGDQVGAIDRVSEAATRAASGVEQLQSASTAASERVARIAEAAGTSGRALANLGSEVPTSEFSTFNDVGRQLQSGLEGLVGETDQISHSFAEFGAAGAAAGGAVHGLVGMIASAGPAGLATAAAIGLLTAALYGAFDGALKAEREQAELERAIRSAGAQSAITVRELQDYATALSHTTMASRDDVLAAGTALLQFHSVAGEVFQRTLALGQDMASALGGDLRANVQRLGQALEDPAKALDDLTKAGVRFTDQERETIRSLSESGQAFAAQQAILAAVARDLGGAGAGEREGLIGRTRDLKEAWEQFVAAVTGSDSALGQAAANILTTMSGLIRHLNAELDDSVAAQIGRLEQQRDVLAAQLQSGDFGLKSLFSKEFWSNSTDVEGARRRLDEVNAALAVLQERQRRDEVAAAGAAEDASARAVAQQRQVLLDRLAAMHAETERKLADLSTDRIAKISAAEEAEVRRLEGMRAEAAARGASPEELQRFDQQILAVRSLSLAERAAAEPKQQLAEATDQEVDANQQLIQSLQGELELIQLSARERSIETALRRLSAEATDDQRAKVRELAAALYDQKTAAEAAAHAQKVIADLQQQLGTLNASPGDLAAAHALKQLGENASAADQELASFLAHQLADARDAKKIIDDVKSSAEKYEEVLKRLNQLLEKGAIDHATYAKAADKAYREMLEGSTKWQDGVERGWLKWREAAYDSAKQAERVFSDTMSGMEDLFVTFVKTGKLNFDDLTERIIDDLLRIFYEREIMGPLGDALFGTGSASSASGSLFSSLFGGLFAQGAAFEHGAPVEVVPHALGDIIDRPSWFPMAGNQIGTIAETDPEAIMPLRRLPSGRLGVEATGSAAGQAIDQRSYYSVAVDARGATDPAAVAAAAERAVTQALSQAIPGIVRTSAQAAVTAIIDDRQRRGLS